MSSSFEIISSVLKKAIAKISIRKKPTSVLMRRNLTKEFQKNQNDINILSADNLKLEVKLWQDFQECN